MTSRSWYDLVTRTVTYNEERARSQMTDFVQQYHNPMRFEDASDQAEIDSQPFEHGGLIPTGKGVLGFTAALPNSPLCSTCAAMLDTPNSWQAPTASNEQQTRLSLTYQMLVDASTQGCHICFLQVQRLEAKHDRELLSKINYRDHYFWETKPGSGAFIGRPRTTQTHGIGITYFISSETTPETLGDGRGNSFVLTEAQGS